MKKKQNVRMKKPSARSDRSRHEAVIDRFLHGGRIRGREDRQILADWLAPVLAELDAMAVREEAEGGWSMSADAASPAPSAIQFSLRACCADAPRGAGFVEVKGAPGPLAASDAPVVVEGFARPAYETDRATAWHEGAHALAAIVAGGKVDRVTIREPNPLAACRNVPLEAHSAFALAGPHAENLARGWLSPIAQNVVAEHLGSFRLRRAVLVTCAGLRGPASPKRA